MHVLKLVQWTAEVKKLIFGIFGAKNDAPKIVDVVISAVRVVIYPGYSMRLTTAVIRKRFRFFFWGSSSITMFVYVTVRSEGICCI